MNYKERLDRLVEAWEVQCSKCKSRFSTAVFKKLGKEVCPSCGSYELKYLPPYSEKHSKINLTKIREVQDIDLAFDFTTNNTIPEFFDFIKRYMKQYNIGSKISKRFWGIRGFKDIQDRLYKTVKKQVEEKEPVKSLKIYDDLQKNVDGKTNKDYTPYAYARVARTESKSITIIYKLEKFKEAGLKYVKYRTRGDDKVRDEHKVLNGREFEIEYLLSQQGEKDRIPQSPNCRCTYDMSMKGV
jgi:SPP1 gp7 family putative phage head morphogenesis protein